MRKEIFILLICPYLLFSQGNINLDKTESMINISQQVKITDIVPLNNISNITLPNKISLSRNTTLKITEPLTSKEASDVLYPTQFSAFEINPITKTINYIGPQYSISQICWEAINISPRWLEKQLILKFRELKSLGLDDDYAQLILNAEKIDKKIVDEVAFQVANLATNSLNNSRFKADKEYLIRNAQFIYKVVDSLRYVELVEYGNYENRDYYTTTKYKIADGKNGPVNWVELPYDKYYWYIVHPKLNAEGVWVQDDINDQQQRTWGYSWREYIWSNPDPQHNYTSVNLSANGITVDYIPRFGAMMQGPDVLWNRNKNYYLFGRPLQVYEHALDLLGNWGSCAIPADPIANQPRAIHPNQVLYYHRGRCGEDSYLMTAACRTALIPAICSGTSREDHVWDQFWDKDWNHFEFFRGGLAYSGWGWTNLMDMGGYEELSPDYWVLSFVHGYRPDGFIFNHTKYYTKTCELKLKLVDNNNLPLDGIQTKIFARPGHNNDPNDNGILYAGQAFSNSNGDVSILAGDRKVYYLQFYHPKTGTLPAEGQVYIFTSESVLTTYDRIYDGGTVKIPVNIQKLQATSEHAPASGQYGFHLKWKATEIITGINDLDFQKSKFYFWNDSVGSVSFFLCDEDNFNKFKNNLPFDAYEVYNYTDSGDVNIALPTGDKWYVVLSNTQSYNNYQNIDAKCELLEDVQTSILINGDPVLLVEDKNVDKIKFNVYPNPFTEHCNLELPENIERVEIYNYIGEKVDSINYPFIWKPNKDLLNGLYLFKAISEDKVLVTQSILIR
jgi:hypothetical protein